MQSSLVGHQNDIYSTFMYRVYLNVNFFLPESKAIDFGGPQDEIQQGNTVPGN